MSLGLKGFRDQCFTNSDQQPSFYKYRKTLVLALLLLLRVAGMHKSSLSGNQIYNPSPPQCRS